MRLLGERLNVGCMGLALAFIVVTSCSPSSSEDKATWKKMYFDNSVGPGRSHKELIAKSWNFLRAYIVLNDTSDSISQINPYDSDNQGEFGPSVKYLSESKRWNVFYTDGLNAFNVQLDDKLEKGTILRMDGMMYVSSKSEGLILPKGVVPLLDFEEFKKAVKGDILVQSW